MSRKKFVSVLITYLTAITLVLTLTLSSKTVNAGTVILPEHPGTATEKNDKAIIDYSNADSGYIMVKYLGKKSKVKLQIIKDSTYTYDLKTDGKWDSFPLTEGSGDYNVRVMENISGNRYSFALETNIDASISNSLKPFLISHQRISFNSNTKFIKQADKLTKGKKNDLDKVSAIYNWIIKYMHYDYNKAKTVRPGYIPDLNKIYNQSKGICYDYASSTAAMLRSQGIPTKMVFGYVGKNNEYHAWISVYLKEKGWVNNIIQFKANRYTLMDPTFASGGSKDPSKNRYTQRSVY